jgi:ketosteroid isomerase-like protein
MKRTIWIGASALVLAFACNAFAGDKEDVAAAVNKVIKDFNVKDYPAYFAAFTSDFDAFTTGTTPLRYDAASWKVFIEGLSKLAFVDYQQQDNVIRILNGNTAVVSGYYVFKVMPQGGTMVVENGRASIVMVKQSGKWLIAHNHFSKLF